MFRVYASFREVYTLFCVKLSCRALGFLGARAATFDAHDLGLAGQSRRWNVNVRRTHPVLPSLCKKRLQHRVGSEWKTLAGLHKTWSRYISIWDPDHGSEGSLVY